jgi:catechol 2,3-dioxygenase-like lactoylglutathione lyase family enzyme
MSDDAGVQGIEHGFVARDAARLAAFYATGLLFETVAAYEFPRGTVHRMRRGAARMKLFQPADGIGPRVAAEPWYSIEGAGYGALLVDDAVAEVERAQAAGAELLEGVISHRPGAQYALLRDPEGNVWEILQEG